jgi:hypothetical protein
VTQEATQGTPPQAEEAPEASPHADFFSCQVAAYQANPQLEKLVAASAEALMAFYRFAKIVLVHSLDNAAVRDTLEDSTAILHDFGQIAGDKISFTFVSDTIFVCGELLKAPRGTYEQAAELGLLLQRCGTSEVTLNASFEPQDLLDFAVPFVAGCTRPEHRGALLKAKVNSMKFRAVDSSLERKEDDHDLPIKDRILRLYASALVVLRQFFDAVAEGRSPMPHRIKRIAQRLVSLSQTNDPALLGMTTMANAHRDDAGRALQSAILAIQIARQITDDRLLLSRIAMAALMTDVGRARVLGKEGRDRLVPLTPEQNAKVPSTTSAICIANGGVNASTAIRTVVTFETSWLERMELLGPPYNKRLSTLAQSRILQLVRRLLDHLAPRDTSRAKSPLDSLHSVIAEPWVDPVLRRILVAAIGLVPTGTIIEFETGEWGVVVGPSADPEAVNRPKVRLITDKSGRALDPPKEVDLGAPPPGYQFPQIARIIEPGSAKFNAAHAFLS